VNLVGIDPGETTGLCMFSKEKFNMPDTYVRRVLATESEYYWYGEVSTDSPLEYYMFGNWLSYANQSFCMQEDVTFILERFEWRKDPVAQERSKISYVPAEVCGIAKERSIRDRFTLVEQSASQATGHGKGNEGAFWDDHKLKKLGLYVPGKRHAMDALRHVLYYRTFTLQDQTLLRRLR
jgi:hypothetical protein